MNIKKWISKNCVDLKGKTIAITGSTGGLASFVVEVLARLNTKFIFINRDNVKTKKQMEKLKVNNPNVDCKFIYCDLADFKSVKSATELLKKEKIDILYLASGVYNIARYKTDIGYDNVFQTNFISHYYIAKELLSKIKAEKGKIVAVGSIAYNHSKIDLTDIDFSNQKKHSKVYGNSKRFIIYSLSKLCYENKVDFSLVHPGVTLTNITHHYPKGINWLVKIFISAFCPSVNKACLSLIKGVFINTPYAHWLGPKICNVWGNPKINQLKSFNTDEVNFAFYTAENIYEKIRI